MNAFTVEIIDGNNDCHLIHNQATSPQQAAEDANLSLGYELVDISDDGIDLCEDDEDLLADEVDPFEERFEDLYGSADPDVQMKIDDFKSIRVFEGFHVDVAGLTPVYEDIDGA